MRPLPPLAALPSPLVALLLGLASACGTGWEQRGRQDSDDDGSDDDTGSDDDASDDDGSDDDASESEADRNDLAVTSPAEGAQPASWEPVAVAASATDPGGGSVTPASVSWASSAAGDLGLGSLAGQVTLPAGGQTVTVTVTWSDGSGESASVGVTPLAPSPYAGDWRGSLSATVETVYEGWDVELDCAGQINFTITGAGVASGTGSCDVDLVDYTVTFNLTGQLSGDAFDGTLSATFEGETGTLPTTGAFGGDSGQGSFEYHTPEGSLDGTWLVHRI